MVPSEVAAAMAERGIALVPTMIATRMWPDMLKGNFGSPSDEIERAAKETERHPEKVRAAWEAGVTLLAGTDAGLVSHGLVRDEIRAFVEAGISPEDALAAGSWKARSYLGFPGIEDGAPADLVAFKRNPMEDPAVLEEPALIILSGAVVRSPERAY